MKSRETTYILDKGRKLLPLHWRKKQDFASGNLSVAD